MNQLTDRQLAITLAALSYMHRHLQQSPMFAAAYLEDQDPIIKLAEIDEICELLNSPTSVLQEADAFTCNVTTLDNVKHAVLYDSIEEFIAANQGNLVKASNLGVVSNAPRFDIIVEDTSEEHY